MAASPVDAASRDDARRLLRTCCGSEAWVDAMLRRRPFGTLDALLRAAREEWFALSRADWLEAFAAHPKIGDREALRHRFPETAHLASAEQAGVAGAPDAVLDALAEGNAAYERQFGYIFIVCASGLTAEEMLRRLRERLANDPEAELRVAAGEQASITALRLQKIASG